MRNTFCKTTGFGSLFVGQKGVVIKSSTLSSQSIHFKTASESRLGQSVSECFLEALIIGRDSAMIHVSIVYMYQSNTTILRQRRPCHGGD